MKNIFIAALLLVSLPAVAAPAEPGAPGALVEPGLKYGNFGRLEVFPANAQPNRLILFFSGEKGWTPQSTARAFALKDDHTTVVGVSLSTYGKEMRRRTKKCLYPAGDLELLSKFLQTRFKFGEYRPPLLVGELEGANLAYAALAQAPKATFTGAISLGFCPARPEKKMFCKGYGLKSVALPKGKGFALDSFDGDLPGWGVLQTAHDPLCAGADKVITGVDGATFRKVSGPLEPALRTEAERLMPAAAPPAPPKEGEGKIADLPLVVVPAAEGKNLDEFVVFYSGDGGWAGFDQELAASLADRGEAVVGLSTLKYFWSAKTPEFAATHLNDLIAYYLGAWKKKGVRIVGYSFGADVMPELISRLPVATQNKIRGVHLLGVSETAEFEFHFESWLGDSGKGLKVKPALEKISRLPVKVQCLYGEEEDDSLCAKLDATKFNVVKLPGGHHFGGDSETLADIILK